MKLRPAMLATAALGIPLALGMWSILHAASFLVCAISFTAVGFWCACYCIADNPAPPRTRGDWGPQ